ncbi:MAG: response regulator [Candidatus Sericytochromatia bacterium]|nr:response regulator [Candidatus Sericytochromatia bacterium]
MSLTSWGQHGVTGAYRHDGVQRSDTVLVVEDEESLSRLWTMCLNLSGYATAAVSNGEEALALFHYAEPDAVVLDLMKPGISGLDLLLYLRRDLAYHGGVVVVTARDEQVPGEYRLAVAYEVLHKGDNTFSNQTLLEALERQLKKPPAGV